MLEALESKRDRLREEERKKRDQINGVLAYLKRKGIAEVMLKESNVRNKRACTGFYNTGPEKRRRKPVRLSSLCAGFVAGFCLIAIAKPAFGETLTTAVALTHIRSENLDEGSRILLEVFDFHCKRLRRRKKGFVRGANGRFQAVPRSDRCHQIQPRPENRKPSLILRSVPL